MVLEPCVPQDWQPVVKLAGLSLRPADLSFADEPVSQLIDPMDQGEIGIVKKPLPVNEEASC